MKQLIEEQRNKAEVAVFWDEIASGLPKSIERSALGDEKICRAFAMAYPKIKQALLKQFIDELIEFEENMLPDECDCTGAKYECEHWGRHETINESIAHLKKLKEELN